MKQIMVFLVALFCVSFAQAQAFDVCALSTKPLPESLSISQADAGQYFAKLKTECQLQGQAQNLAAQLKSQHDLTLENITFYQALRYVQRGYYDKAKYENTPLKVLYQRNPPDYLLPVEKRSTEIWDNWIIGLRRLPSFVEKIRSGQMITIQDLVGIQTGFFSQGNEEGEYTHHSTHGKIKGLSDGSVNWNKIEPKDKVPATMALVDDINRRYAELKLLPNPFSDDSDRHLPLRVTQQTYNGEYYLYSASGEFVEAHLKSILNFLNRQMSLAQRGQHMIWEGHPLTPAETIYLAQQYFIQVHPFEDGNGRTSRFLQDALFAAFGMPYPASGDLMTEDLSTRQEDYYRLAIAASKKQLAVISDCITTSYPEVAARWRSLKKVPAQYIPYDCRLVYDESPGK